jgi:deoxyhypusine monooxygenase
VQLGHALADASRPLAERFRILFMLKNIGGKEAIDAIAMAFGDESALLKHECAYCLGQLEDAHAIPVLSAVLENTAENPMVRHEAAEALGAIGDDRVKSLLERFVTDPAREVSETCQIAVDRLNYYQKVKSGEVKEDKLRWACAVTAVFGEVLTGDDDSENPYCSVDPAPPAPMMSVQELRGRLLDKTLPLFDRYRAMFALRNRGGSECVQALVDGFHDESALFRHEIAYVLGQMQDAVAVPGLMEVCTCALSAVGFRRCGLTLFRVAMRQVLKADTNPMVRHECAEALGSIADDDCLPTLQSYAKDDEQVVKESCVVALDMHEFESSNEFVTLEQGVERVLAH